MQGRVVAMVIKEKSINITFFIEFLHKLARKMNYRKTYVMLDNLQVHYNIRVKNKAKSCNQVLLYTATYSSKCMPAERLWCLAKR